MRYISLLSGIEELRGSDDDYETREDDNRLHVRLLRS